MANYRQIHVQIWKDAWFLELSPEHKLLFIYLFSNERTSVAGIYDISLRVVAFETDLSREVIDEGLTLFAAADKIFYQDGVVWVKNLRKYNATNSIKVHERIRRDLEALKDCPLKDAYIAAEGMPIGTQNMPPAPPKRTGHPPGSRASATAVRLRLVSERGEACEQCGVASPVELHHIIPARAGGTLDDDNCILLCDECHQKADNENEERYPIPLTEIPYPAGVGEHVHVPSHAPVLAPVPALALGPAPSDKHPALMLYEQVTDRSVPNDTWRKRIQAVSYTHLTLPTSDLV